VTATGATILALNPGSSSLKAAVKSRHSELSISVDQLGRSDGMLVVGDGAHRSERPFTAGLDAALGEIRAELEQRGLVPDAVAHRVVHGGPKHFRPTRVDDDLLADLQAVIPLAPLHLPGDLEAIAQARHAWPDAVHVACFDTGFHHALPEQAVRLPVPAEFVELGIRRYGFHGLSIQSVLHARPDIGDAVIAHLGSGCSVTAVAAGQPRHTTMSLTPTGGMVSVTRTGDIDPEIVLYLIQQHGYPVERLRALLDRESGIAGVAGGRSDVRSLLAATDDRATLALDIFVRSAAMAIASCATTLDHWETLVFTGGVGEHSAPIRERICAALLSVRGGTAAISGGSAVQRLAGTGIATFSIEADEAGVLDRSTRELLGPSWVQDHQK
jgi:acetate kinase